MSACSIGVFEALISYPEDRIAIPSVPIVRDDKGKQVPLIIFASLYWNAEGRISVDLNGLPVIRFYTRNVNTNGYFCSATHVQVPGSNPALWVERITILHIGLVFHNGDGDACNLYKAIITSFDEMEHFSS
ncbi:hypothetical protein NX059_012307 [Plenodomus lindquistii]|nr:hypothetical protein NX059_012307 [Plenodomus lindquistii]